MFLEPFEPEINHGSNKERDHLRKDKTADDHESERTSRGSVLSKTKSEWHRAHQCGQRRHHDRTKTFDTRFMNCRAQVPTLVDSLQRKVDHHDPVLFHDAEQKKKSYHAVER